jgi:hypothetical protein
MMHWTHGLISTAALSVIYLAAGCSNLADDCENTSSCPSGGGSSNAGSSGASGKSGNNAGGSDAAGESGSSSGGSSSGTSGSSGNAGGGGAGGGSCDTTKTPTEESCLVSDDYAVFVSPDGDDDNAGSQAAPLASLSKAAEIAGDKFVLVCSATYDEHVSIAAGVRIYGGFKCTDWSSDAEKPLFKPTTNGPALKVDTVADEVLIDNVAFEVGDAATAGETALTAIVNASPKVTLHAVSLKAGKGKTGANGALTEFAFPDAATLNGNPEIPAGSGGASKKCECQPALSSVGGVGGTPVDGGQSGSKGLPDHGGGQPGQPGSCVPNGGGSDGNAAPDQSPASGATLLGAASATGWLAAAGTDGATGEPGQGGGGGASRNSAGHGGGGGCGGCGGNGGMAGKGGGGSIALLAVNSPVTVEGSTLTTADAGNGGSGAAGQPGQSDIGAGGGVVSSINSCAGGNGGMGAAGGAGGGGAGGISVGIVWKGAKEPSLSADTMITNGKAGTKGTGGEPGTNDGIAGVAQKILALN